MTGNSSGLCSNCTLRELCGPSGLIEADTICMDLRMSRDEICSYLGLRLETVSRAFSKLQSDGLIDVHHRQIRIRDISRLKRHHRSDAGNGPTP